MLHAMKEGMKYLCDGGAKELEQRPDVKRGNGAEVPPKQIALAEEDVDSAEEKRLEPKVDEFHCRCNGRANTYAMAIL